MAILNNTTLNNLRTTIRGEFNVAFKNANAGSMYKRLATTIPSSSKTNTYDWLGKFPQMREWVGSRVLKDMSESSYQIANKKYEATLGVDRKVAELLKNGFSSTCYDGQNFFDEEHPVYPNADGTGEADSVSNILKKTDADAGTPWFLLSLNRPLKPLIHQQRTGMELESLTDTKDESVFMEDKIRFGIRYRGNFGYGLWQQAVASKANLDAANFESAYKLMQSFKRDGGDPMGIVPTALVVPPELQSDAEKILKRTALDNGAGNINYNKVELIVNPWLA